MDSFIVSYTFLFRPLLVLVDATLSLVAQMNITSVVGMIGVGAAVEGWYWTHMAWWERIVVLAAGPDADRSDHHHRCDRHRRHGPSDDVPIQAIKKYEEQVKKLMDDYNQRVALWSTVDKDFASGSTALGVITESGGGVCQFSNTWLWLVGTPGQ